MNNEKNSTTKYGIIAGLATIGYFIIFYFINKALILNPFILWFPITIYIYFMVKAGKEIIKSKEDLFFRDVIKPVFKVYVLTTLMYYLFYFILLKFDTELLELQKQIAGGFSDQTGNWDFSNSIKGYLIRLNFSIIGGFILSLIISGFIYKNK